MNTTATRRFDNSHLISPTWIMDSLRDVRDLLQAEGREHLASAISACLGGLLTATDLRFASSVPQARNFLDGGPDFEDVADPCEWPAWTDESTWTTTEPTPLELLPPPIRGGSPEAYEPTADDLAELSRWSAEFAAHLDDVSGGIEVAPSYFTEGDARAAGLAV